MILSDTDQKILENLIECGEYVTGAKLSDLIGVSTKTIYRRAKHIRSLFGEEIITSERGKGYKINYEIYLTILNKYYSENGLEMFKDNRRMSILLNLLTNSPEEVSISYLSQKYFVSQSSIVSDLKFIKEEIDNTKLILSQTNTGTSIIGKETEIRKELMHIFNKFLTNVDGFTLKELTTKNKTVEHLKTHFGMEEINTIKSILDSANDLLGYELENPYYINLLTHLLILLKRHKNNIETNGSEREHVIKNYDTQKYQVAQYIISEINKKFNIVINPKEIDYVYTYYISTRNTKESQKYQLNDLEINTTNQVEIFVNEIIQGMEEKLNINFSDDLMLKKSLLLHIQPMLNRIKYKIIIVNPLIEDIKEEFSNTFYSVKKIVLHICKKYNIQNISDHEIGYIAVYFQNTIEKVTKQLNVLIVCTTGIGTSHLLKTRLINNFPMLNIKGLISANEVKEYDEPDIDFILTTVNLPKTNTPQLLIGALLDKKDVKIINQFINNNYGSLI